MKLSLEEARRLQLQSQGLSSPTPFGLGEGAVLKALRRISYVQIDTISVVQRAHHHILWSRVPNYRPEWLHKLQSVDKKIFEYWSHAAAYLPIEDYRFCLPRMMRYRAGDNHWWAKDKKVMKQVFDRIQKEGPLLARDFENTTGKRAGPWFDRTPAKKALEQLFQEGRLVISERRGFQKVYELSERYLPSEVDTSIPTRSEFARYLITSTLTANGLATAKEIAYLRKKETLNEIEKELKVMIKEGLVEPTELKGSKLQFYSPVGAKVPADLSSQAKILSPFDNLVIQRARLNNLFNFDYQIECYVPQAKRKYGYFVLPVLYEDKFVARFDCKTDRTSGTFIIKAVHYETSMKKNRKKLKEPLTEALEKFAKFNQCDRIQFEGTKL